jgi:hypothetical protein
MKSNSRWVWFVVLGLGWLLDFLFWKQQPGVNFAIYVFLCLTAGILLLHISGTSLSARAAWLIPLIAAFAITTFLRAEPLTVFLGVVFALFLMATLAVSYVSGRWLEFGLADYAVRFLLLGWGAISRPFGFRAPGADQPTGVRSSSRGLWPVLRGVLLALPILLIFGVLLGSADLVFQRELDALISLLRLERLPEFVFRLLYVLAAAWTLLGVFLHAASQNRSDSLLGDRVQAGTRFLGFTEASIVLAGVVLLFSAFVLVQFRYFFGGAQNIGLDGYTFAEYARRGYGELMAVAVLSLLLLLGLGTITRRASIRQQRIFSGLSIAVVVLVGVMLVSAYMRLGLYEMAYGYTRLRTYVHVSLIWLGVLLAAVVALEVVRRERWFASAALACSLGFGLTVAVLNVDAFIAAQNVSRAQRGQGLDVAHLGSLSTDAVPGLVELFRSDATMPDTREAVGAALACGWNSPRQQASTDWRSFSLSRWRSEQALARASDELLRYRVVTEDWVTTVRSPQGHYFECTTSWD